MSGKPAQAAAAVEPVAAPAPVVPPGDAIAVAGDVLDHILALVEAGEAGGFALEVRGPLKGRRRAGFDFAPVPRIIPLGELSEDAVATIEGDPELLARLVPVSAE